MNRYDSFEIEPATIRPPDGEYYPALNLRFWLNGSEDEVELTLIGDHKSFRAFTSGLHSAIDTAETQARKENRE